jgi:Cu+-exporting ATPase
MEMTMTAQVRDPVCGMILDPAKAVGEGLVTEHEGTTYYFCARGCLLDFRDDPGRYLDPSYQPQM